MAAKKNIGAGEETAAVQAAPEKTGGPTSAPETAPEGLFLPDVGDQVVREAPAQSTDGVAGVAGFERQGGAKEAPLPEHDSPPRALPEEPLYTLSGAAEKFRVPAWQSAALHTLMEWAPGKRVREGEYASALARLKNRRIGG
jgi:hypothetical protein